MHWSNEPEKVIHMPDLSRGEPKAVVTTSQNDDSIQFSLFIPYDILDGKDKKKVGEVLTLTHVKLDETAKVINTAFGEKTKKSIFEEIFGKA